MGQKDPLEKGMATHSNILPGEFPWTEELVGYSPWGHKELDKFTFASLITLKPLTVWITTNCENFSKRWEQPDQLTCLLRNLYAGQEATGRTRHGTMDWFEIGKGEHQGYILSTAYLTYMQSM